MVQLDSNSAQMYRMNSTIVLKRVCRDSFIGGRRGEGEWRKPSSPRDLPAPSSPWYYQSLYACTGYCNMYRPL